MKKEAQSTSDARALIFGEVLFDAFAGGVEVLGGAPFNVAWHLQGLGMQPLFVSRIGDDERGARVLRAMQDWGMDTRGLQRDDECPTGLVRIDIRDGQPVFDILPAQAYDHIDSSYALRAAFSSAIDVIYHGTLALRSAVSRTTLHTLRARLDTRVYVDLNLRSPWWSESDVNEALFGATWVKLNDEELGLIAEGLGIGDEQQARALCKRFGIQSLVVTRGSNGAFIRTADRIAQGDATCVDKLVDTVGAGDAFATVALIGFTRGWPAEQTLARALDFAAWICGVRGATVADVDRYALFREAWGLDVEC
ncbi:MAG: PfkB family carbohydrate kinase [Chromatiales bacterium]|jgi:fructokinase|nr:PfkB family carbohydrate kinase [Chromatiales bacterium]